MSEPTTLRVALGKAPLTDWLMRSRADDTSLHLVFEDIEPIHKAFSPMVRRQAYDVSELAIVTALQAIAYGRPIMLLPAVVASRFQRRCLIGDRARGVPSPEQLVSARIGVRAYTQTTGMWVRAHLAEDYDLPIERMRWLTRDDAHVAEFRDPSCVERLESDASLPELLRAGEIDAAILGNDLPTHDTFAPVIPDAGARDLAWWKTHGFMPINHMVAVSLDIARQRPEAIREFYRRMREGDLVTRPSPDEPCPTRFGFEALRKPVEFVVDACLRQGLLPRRLDVGDVLGPARSLLQAD